MWIRTILFASLLVFLFDFQSMARQFDDLSSSAQRTMPASPLPSLAHWRALKPFQTFKDRKLTFYKFATENGSQACLVVLDLNDRRLQLTPFFNRTLATTFDVARTHGALVAANGGFFNLSDGQSTSYVVINGHNQCEPKTNKDLVENPKLAPYLQNIYNRSELRILKDINGKTRVEIGKHNDPVPDNCRLEGALQAGPQLLPTLTDREEAFVRTGPDGIVTDSIGSHKQAARTACGITPDGKIMLLCVASKGQNKFSSGVTLLELADILRKLSCNQAINFDGGTSTTMVISSETPEAKAANGSSQFKQVCGRTPEKLVKSGLMIKSSDF